MNILKMVVSQLVKQSDGSNKAEEVGKVEVPCFSLAEFGLAVEPVGIDADGLLKYADAKVQWVYDATVGLTKANARNKLMPKSVTLIAGTSIADSVEKLIVKGEASGEALKQHREFCKSFAAFLAANSGKSAKIQATYAGLVDKKASIALASEPCRNGLLAQLANYQSTSPDAERFNSQVETIGTLCAETEEISDEDY